MAVTGSTTAKNELPTRIHCDRLLLVEGKDEKGFFDKWLLQIVASSVQIVDIGGKDKFHTKFPTITNLPGFRNVQRLGIIRDAEESYTSTFQSIKNTLSSRNMPLRSAGTMHQAHALSLGVWIMPDNQSPGSIENLCWDLIPQNDQRLSCTNSFIDCLCSAGLPPKSTAGSNIILRATSPFLPERLEKTKVQAYLGALCEPKRELGRAAEADVWDFTHQRLNDLRNFLTTLFN